MIKLIALCFFIVLSLQAIEQPLFLGKEGKTYKPTEPDMYEVLKKKFQKFQEENNVTQILSQAIKKKAQINLGIQTCETDRIYNKKLLYIVPEDVVFQGAVIAKKGQVVNLLKKMPLQGLVIFSNYSTAEEKNTLMNIIIHYDTTLRIYLTKGNIMELKEDIEKYFPDRDNIISGKTPKTFLDKFNISCVPAVAYQKDYEMVISEIGIKNDE